MLAVHWEMLCGDRMGDIIVLGNWREARREAWMSIIVVTDGLN